MNKENINLALKSIETLREVLMINKDEKIDPAILNSLIYQTGCTLVSIATLDTARDPKWPN